MNILLLTHIYPPAIDGGSRVIFKLGEQLAKKNKILVLTTNCRSTDDFINPKSVPLRSIIDDRRSILRLPVYKNLRRPLKLICLFLPKNSYFRQFLEVFQKGPIFKLIPFLKAIYQINKFKPELIITGPLPTTIIIYANFIKFLTNAKLLINASFHQTDSDFFKKPLIKTLKNSDYIWSLTNYEKDFFINKLNIKKPKILVLGNGVDKNFITSPLSKVYRSPEEGSDQGGLNILFIGSLAAHKGLELLINAFSDLTSSFHQGRMPRNSGEVGLTIAGQKTLYYPKIKEKLKNKRIKIIFNFPQKKLKSLIDSCTCLILPSTQESFGLVLIEAMARGKPVIGTDIPPIKELIAKTKGGLTFKKDNLKSLTAKIEKLINNPSLCQKLGQNGLKNVQKYYTWDKIGKEIKENVIKN